MNLDDYVALKRFNSCNLSFFDKEENIDLYLSKLGILKSDSRYLAIKDFINNINNTSVKIDTMKKVFKVSALDSWYKHRSLNIDLYFNNFNKTLAVLKKYNTFSEVISNLKYIEEFRSVMKEEEYNKFIYYLEKLHNTKNIKNNELDVISKMLSLYSAKAKERFVSNYIDNSINKFIGYFSFKSDNYKVKEKLIIKKQREKLRMMYKNNELEKSLNSIISKYCYSGLDNKFIVGFIDEIILNNISNFRDSFIDIPNKLDDYNLYEEVSKIINRLNSNYIPFSSKEVDKYRNYIIKSDNKYVYNGVSFTNEELKDIKNYKYLEFIFNKIRRDIALFSKSLDVVVSDEEVNLLKDNFSFNDEFYELKEDRFMATNLSLFGEFVAFLARFEKNYLEDREFMDFFVNSSLIGFLLFSSSIKAEVDENLFYTNVSKNIVNVFSIVELMKYYEKIKLIIGSDKFNLDNLYNILKIKDSFKQSSLLELSILGSDNLAKIASSNEYTASTRKERINASCDLVSMMYKRNKSSVAYVSGKYNQYKYSMYDVCDVSSLTCGIDIGSCLRLTGNDSDLLQYCMLNKNGFVLKITNEEDKLIGRAAGFRHGNVVYINQFITVFNRINAFNCEEKEDILNTFYMACRDIVLTSQKSSEKVKIDFVLANKLLALYDLDDELDEDTFDYVVSNCMDTKSDNWFDFINNTRNLNSYKNGKIKTDFGASNIVCIYSNIGKITRNKIKLCDVDAIYKRKRNDVRVYSNNIKIESYINRIRAIDSYIKKDKFEYLKLSDKDRTMIGDNWYIVYDSNKIIDSLVLDEDMEAEVEYMDNLEYLNYLLKLNNKKKIKSK